MVSEVNQISTQSPSVGDDEKKDDSEFLEEADKNRTSISELAASHLSQAHREFLLQRHGTLELDPLPSASHADPYNWPSWKVKSPGVNIRASLIHEMQTETREPRPRCLPCLHVHVHSLHHPRLRGDLRGPRSIHAKSQLSYLAADCCARRCASLLEAPVEPIWPSTHFPLVDCPESSMQCWLCQKP